MMQPTPKLLNSTVNGRILAQRQVRARRVVVVHINIRQQHVTRVPLAEHDDMVEAALPTTGWRCSSRGSAGEFPTVQLVGRSGAAISSANTI